MSRFFSQTGAANKPPKAFSKSLSETWQSGYQQPNWKKEKLFNNLHPLLKWMVKECFSAVRAGGQKLGTHVLSVGSCWLARVSRMPSLVAEHFPYLLIVLSLSTRGMTAPIRLERNVILPPSLLSARVWLISSPVEKGVELQPKDLFSTLITLWEWPPSTALLKPWLCHSPWAFSQAGVQHLRSAVSRGPWRCSPCWHYWVVKGNREAHLYTAPKTPGYFSVQQQTVDQLLVLLLSML